MIDAAFLARRARHNKILTEIEEAEAQKAYWEAQQLKAVAELERDPLPLPNTAKAVEKRWVREELACVLKISPDTAGWRLSVASRVDELFPEALKLLESGQISMRHVWALNDATKHLDPHPARAVLDRVIDRMADQSPTTFTQSVKRAVMSVAPKTADERHDDAAGGRRVSGRDGDDGMSQLYANLPTPDERRILAAVDALARKWAAVPGESRTLDQLRADALSYLVCQDKGGDRPGASIQVTVALSTLLGLDDQPAELDDGTPLTAAQARLLAEDRRSTWRRLITDERGRLVDYGRTVYRPPAPLANFVRARDPICSYPHCNRPAMRCDLDHRRDWGKGGCTNEHNLHPLCERHHNAKHEAGWWVTVRDDAVTEWISPTGRIFTKPPWLYPVDRTGSAPEDHEDQAGQPDSPSTNG